MLRGPCRLLAGASPSTHSALRPNALGRLAHAHAPPSPSPSGGSIYIQGRGRGAAMIDKKADPGNQAWGQQITVAEPTYKLSSYLQMIGASGLQRWPAWEVARRF